MQSKYKLKIICGFRQDQEYTIDANEAHKAYYLFNKPTARAVFSNGLAIQGDDVKRIVPDYHATMGWNSTHRLDDDDMNEIHSSGISSKLQYIMSLGKEIARVCEPSELTIPMLTLVKEKYQGISSPSSRFAQQVLANKQ